MHIYLFQQQLGNFDANFYSTLWKNSPPPPPGSESERELLKTYLLKVLQTIDARQLTVCWPTIPTALEKEPLFVIKVAGPECGAVSESIAQVKCCVNPYFTFFSFFPYLERTFDVKFQIPL